MTIKQRIELDGSQVKQQFEQLAAAASSFFNGVRSAAAQGGDIAKALNTDQARQQVDNVAASARSLSQVLQQVSQGARGAADDLQAVGANAQKAGQSVDSTASRLSSAAKGLTALTVGAIGLGAALFAAARKSAEAATEIKDAADEAGTSVESFEKGRFALEQMGLTSEKAQEAISGLVGKVKDNTAAAADALDKMGFRFADTEAGIEALKSAIGELGGTSATLGPLIQQLQKIGIFVAPGPEQAATVAKMAQAFGLAGGALQKLKDEEPDAIEAIKQVADAIKDAGDEALQKQLAINAFGDDLGPKLVEKLKEGSAGIDEFVKDFEALRLGVSDAQVELGQNFNNAMKRFTAATTQGRIEFGSNFLPLVTQGITQFTNLLRLNRQPIQEWAAGVADSIKSLVTDLFALFNGRRDLVKTGWLGSLADAVSSIIIPGLKALGELAQATADKINASLGTKLSATDIGLAGVISFLLGGLTSVGLAIAAVFGGKSPALDSFSEKLKSIGIDVEAIKQFFIDAFEELKSQIGKIDFKGVFGEAGLSAKGIATTLGEMVIAILAVRRAAAVAAPVISKLIGKEVSGDALLGASAFLEWSGALGLFTHVAEIGFFATGVLVHGLQLLTLGLTLAKSAMGALAQLVGWPLILAAGLAVAITNFDAFAHLLKPIADSLNSLFGSQFFSGVNLAIGLIAAIGLRFVQLAAQSSIIMGTLRVLGVVAAAAIGGVAALLGVPTLLAAGIVAALTAAIAAIIVYRQEIVAAFVGAWEIIKDAAQAAWDGIVSLVGGAVVSIGNAFSGVVSAITQPFQDAYNTISGILDAIAQKIQSVLALLPGLSQAAQDAGFSGDGSTGPGGAPFAAGGYTGNIHPSRVAGVVHGGEYVQPAWIVAKRGVREFMETLRRVGDLDTAINYYIRGFSLGGLVDNLSSSLMPPVPGFASGGFVPARAGGSGPSRSPVTFVIDGKSFGGFFGDDNAIDTLARHSTKSQVLSTGPKPRWRK